VSRIVGIQAPVKEEGNTACKNCGESKGNDYALSVRKSPPKKTTAGTNNGSDRDG
jgi:hypothetical protein